MRSRLEVRIGPHRLMLEAFQRVRTLRLQRLHPAPAFAPQAPRDGGSCEAPVLRVEVHRCQRHASRRGGATRHLRDDAGVRGGRDLKLEFDFSLALHGGCTSSGHSAPNSFLGELHRSAASIARAGDAVQPMGEAAVVQQRRQRRPCAPRRCGADPLVDVDVRIVHDDVLCRRVADVGDRHPPSGVALMRTECCSNCSASNSAFSDAPKWTLDDAAASASCSQIAGLPSGASCREPVGCKSPCITLNGASPCALITCIASGSAATRSASQATVFGCLAIAATIQSPPPAENDLRECSRLP